MIKKPPEKSITSIGLTTLKMFQYRPFAAESFEFLCQVDLIMGRCTQTFFPINVNLQQHEADADTYTYTDADADADADTDTASSERPILNLIQSNNVSLSSTLKTIFRLTLFFSSSCFPPAPPP